MLPSKYTDIFTITSKKYKYFYTNQIRKEVNNYQLMG
jgi:hypothetical protein